MIPSNNMTSGALKTILILGMGTFSTAAVGFATQILLARILTAENYGHLSSAIATIMIIAPFAGFGVGSFMLKVFGHEGWSATRWIGPILKYIALTTLAVCLILTSWLVFTSRTDGYTVLLFALIPIVLGQAAITFVGSKLQLEERYTALNFWLFGTNGLRLGAVVCLVFLPYGTISAIVVASIYSTIALTFVVLGLNSASLIRRGKFNLKGHPSTVTDVQHQGNPCVANVARNSWQFGLSGALYLIYYQSALILVNWFQGGDIAAQYNVGCLLIGAAYLLPGVIFQKYMLPKLHRWSVHDHARLLHVYKSGSLSLTILGCVAALMLMGVAPYVVPILFGNQYSQAVSILIAMAICIPLRYSSSAADAILTSGRHLRFKVWAQAVVAIGNVATNLLMIGKFGIWGAVFTAIGSEFLMTVLLNLSAYKYVNGLVGKEMVVE